MVTCHVVLRGYIRNGGAAAYEKVYMANSENSEERTPKLQIRIQVPPCPVLSLSCPVERVPV